MLHARLQLRDGMHRTLIGREIWRTHTSITETFRHSSLNLTCALTRMGLVHLGTFFVWPIQWLNHAGVAPPKPHRRQCGPVQLGPR